MCYAKLGIQCHIYKALSKPSQYIITIVIPNHWLINFTNTIIVNCKFLSYHCMVSMMYDNNNIMNAFNTSTLQILLPFSLSLFLQKIFLGGFFFLQVFMCTKSMLLSPSMTFGISIADMHM